MSELARLEQEAEAKAERMKREFEERVRSVKDRIGLLENRKRGILKGRISKREATEFFKQDLEEGRKKWVEDFLRAHLATYQQQVRTFANLDHLRAHILDGGGLAWFAFTLFSLIDDEMISRASANLEEGPGRAEREKAIAELDKQIQLAEKEMRALLE